LVEIAKKNGGQFNITATRELFRQNVNDNLVNNVNGSLAKSQKDFLYGFGLSGGLAAYTIIGHLYGNGTLGHG
jgi:hypothetical protein